MSKYTKIFRHVKPTANKPPWVMRLPRGVRERPSWVFIGSILALVGLTYALGVSQSNVAEAIGSAGLRVWGGILSASGVGIIVATFYNAVAFEKLAQRFAQISILAYVAYVCISVDLTRAAMTLAFGAILLMTCEIRVAFLKLQLNSVEIKHPEVDSGP